MGFGSSKEGIGFNREVLGYYEDGSFLAGEAMSGIKSYNSTELSLFEYILNRFEHVACKFEHSFDRCPSLCRIQSDTLD